jgi:hypothetical protein
MEQLVNFIKDFKIIISTIVAISSLTITLYTGYTSVITEIRDTQIMVLTPLVKTFERSNEVVSDIEYAEYVKNYTKLRQLKIQKGLIPEQAPWSPIEQRIK